MNYHYALKARGKYSIGKYLKRGILYLLFVVMLSSSILPAVAATLEQKEKERNYYSNLSDSAKKKRLEQEKAAADVKAQINNVEGQINSTQSAIRETQADVQRTQQAIEELSAKIKAEEDNIVHEKAKMGRVVASWYMEGEDGLLTAVIGSNNLSDIVTKQEYYNSIRQQITVSMEKIEILKAKLVSQKAEQDQKMISLQDLQRSQEAQRKALENQEWTKRRLLTDTQNMITELKEEEKRYAQLEQQALNEIARIIAARNASWSSQKGKGQRVNTGDFIGRMGNTGYSFGAHLHFEVRSADGSTVNPRNYLGSTFAWPTQSRRVTQEYGWTDFARSGAYGGGIHTGIDMTPGVAGDPIFAAAPGEIVYKDWRGGYGFAVIILHDNGMMTLYAHLESTS
ncbi:MAG: AmiB activator [bacterium ADurb.Bin400]|nr:MAG: AmiB activator [bacterium ADurb.Bin400]